MLLIAGIFYFIGAVIQIGMAREAAKGQASTPALSFAGLKSNLGAMFRLDRFPADSSRGFSSPMVSATFPFNFRAISSRVYAGIWQIEHSADPAGSIPCSACA
ncbi:MAG: hypothetical protein U0X93_03090 [Anaerolineales bacterium]